MNYSGWCGQCGYKPTTPATTPMISFTLPAPPSVNNLYANVPGKGRVRSHRYIAWLEEAGWAMKRTNHGTINFWDTIQTPVSVSIVSGNQRQDIDNMAKAILDLIVDMGVISDDKLVAELHITRGTKSREASVTVTPLLSEEQLDLLGRLPPRSVHERCREKYGQERRRSCVVIFDKDFEPVRFENCRDWCPLLNERIE